MSIRCVIVLAAALRGQPAPTQPVEPPGLPEAKAPAFQEYYHDFRKGKSLAFDPIDAKSEGCVFYEPEGMRIKVPSGYPKESPRFGVSSSIVVSGDFEITTSYEILREPTPEQIGQTGSRCTLSLHFATPKECLTTFSRAANGVSAKPVFVTWSVRWNDEPTKPPSRGRVNPAQTKRGQLRQARTGDVVAFLKMEEGETDFSLLQELPYGKEDVTRIRLMGNTAGPKAPLEFRIFDIRIRGQKLAGLPPAAAGEVEAAVVPEKTSSSSLPVVLGLAIALPVVGGLAWFLWRRRNSAGPGDDAAGDPLIIECPGCGKHLRLKSSLVGKKIKCPECGEKVSVSGTATSA